MKHYDIVIIGSGPAGYVAAIRAGQLGKSVAIVEKDSIGGMCLNWGCIPSKALIESAKLFERIGKAATFGIDGIDLKALSFNWKKAVARKDRLVTRLVKGVEYLLQKNNVETITGVASIAGPTEVKVGEAVYSADKIVIATGSRPNRDAIGNVKPEKVVEIDAFYLMAQIPENILIYGSNAAACENASMLRMIGKKVSLVSPDKEPVPYLDSSLKKFIVDKLKKSGIKMYFESNITKEGDGGVFAGENFIECDTIVNCADRAAILPDISGVEVALENGFVRIDGHMRTSTENIYAIGDCTGQIFAHVGSAQGIAAINHTAGIRQEIDYHKLPSNIYLSPEVSAVGYTEEELKEKGIEYHTGEFPISINGKAMTEGNTEGFVKVIAESKYGEVMGIHIVAPHATDMIAEAVAVMRLEGTLEDAGQIVHAHPTTSEIVMEAVLKTLDRPVHIV